MTMTDATFALRRRPETVGLDAAFRHADGWAALSITGSPQEAELTLTNRMAGAVVIDKAVLDLRFRPGILAGTGAIAIHPQSDPFWHLSTIEPEEGGVGIVLRRAAAAVIEPGASLMIRMTGLTAASAGGSRQTRVQVSYAGLWLADGQEVAGHCLLHLPVLRRHAPEALTRAPERASTAVSGPFFAGIVSGATLINDGLTPNRLVLRIMNVSGRPVRLAHADDEATRLTLGWRQGLRDADLGLLGAEGSHLGLGVTSPGLWQTDRHTVRRVAPGALEPGGHVDLELEVHTNAEDGTAELAVSYANLPDYDDGELRLPVALGPLAVVDGALRATKPLELHGADTRIAFHPGGEGMPLLEPDDIPSLSVARDPRRLGELSVSVPKGMRVGGPLTVDRLTVEGAASTGGPLTVGGALSVDQSLTVGGTLTVHRSLTVQEALNAAHATLSYVDLPDGWRIVTGGSQLQFRRNGKLVMFLYPGGTLASLTGELKVGG